MNVRQPGLPLSRHRPLSFLFRHWRFWHRCLSSGNLQTFCKPLSSAQRIRLKSIPAASDLNKSTSLGVRSECHRSWNSCATPSVQYLGAGRKGREKRKWIYGPLSTGIPPSSSVGLISFQNTIRNCPSFIVRVTSTSPSASSSSMA
jgi:hypothetical protein